MFEMTTYSGPQSLTVPIYGYIMPILERIFDENEHQSNVKGSSHKSEMQLNGFRKDFIVG